MLTALRVLSSDGFTNAHDRERVQGVLMGLMEGERLTKTPSDARKNLRTVLMYTWFLLDVV